MVATKSMAKAGASPMLMSARAAAPNKVSSPPASAIAKTMVIIAILSTVLIENRVSSVISSIWSLASSRISRSILPRFSLWEPDDGEAVSLAITAELASFSECMLVDQILSGSQHAAQDISGRNSQTQCQQRMFTHVRGTGLE